MRNELVWLGDNLIKTKQTLSVMNITVKYSLWQWIGDGEKFTQWNIILITTAGTHYSESKKKQLKR